MIEDVCIVHVHVYYSLVKLGTQLENLQTGGELCCSGALADMFLCDFFLKLSILFASLIADTLDFSGGIGQGARAETLWQMLEHLLRLFCNSCHKGSA